MDKPQKPKRIFSCEERAKKSQRLKNDWHRKENEVGNGHEGCIELKKLHFKSILYNSN